MSTEVKTIPTDDGKRSITSYIIIAVVCVAVLAVVWFAYSRFKKNQGKKNSKKEAAKEEKDEAIADYNLQDAIAELESIQNRVIKNLSSDVGI